MNCNEKQCVDTRYSYCTEVSLRKDFILCVPSNEFESERLTDVIDASAVQWETIKNITGIDPTSINGNRVVIGYRNSSDESDNECNPGYGKDDGVPYINIPWGYLKHDNQPLECLSHEFVHVFADAKKMKEASEAWVEGMCDFVRLFALRAVDMHVEAQKFEKRYRCAASKKDGSQYDYAGRILNIFEEEGGNIQDGGCAGRIIRCLWNKELDKLM